VLLVLAAAAGGTDLLGRGGPARPAGSAGSAGAAGTGHGQATVVRVVDGDTVVLGGLGRSRLIGIDTPEVHGRRACFGAQASAFAERVLRGRRVRYAIGLQPRDRYGRALVYLWLTDGRLVNEMLVAGGYARTLPIAPNVHYASRFRRRADAARAAGRGLWARAACR
jgi:micrococcal nuclease